MDHEDEDALEDDELNIGDGDRQRLLKHFKSFNPEVDMENPSFRLGMVFSGVHEVRKALGKYIVRHRVQIKKTKNDKRRVEAVCAPDDPEE